MKLQNLILAMLTLFPVGELALARINSGFTKTTIGRKTKSMVSQNGSLINSNTSKKRRLYLKFGDAEGKAQPTTDSNASGKNQADSNSTTQASSEPEKIGFTSNIQIGYSGSAYRYSGEEYPSRSIDFGFVPTFDSKCFSIKCIYSLKIIGGFDENNKNKPELALIQLGLKFPGNPWGGLVAPAYSLLGYLPATPKEINVDHMQYGFGGAFILATTPELMGTEFIAFTGSVSMRKNIHDEPLIKQADWVTRQAIITDLNFTKTIGASFVFGHIYSTTYDNTEKEITELIQSIKWQANDWLELNLSHSNIGPMFRGEGAEVNTDLVSIDNSVISVGVSITNAF